MTLDTCYKRLEIAKKANDKDKIDFWEKRIKGKIAKYPKYAHLNKTEVKKNGKK